MKVPRKLLKRKIKKLNKKNQDIVKGLKVYTEKIKRRQDVHIFQKPSEMKKRRVSIMTFTQG